MSDIDEIITKITGTIAEIKQTRQKCLDRIELDTLTVRQCDEDLKKILDAIVGAKPIGRPRDDGSTTGQVLAFFRENLGRPYKPIHVARAMGLYPAKYKAVRSGIDSLVGRGEIRSVGRGAYQA